MKTSEVTLTIVDRVLAHCRGRQVEPLLIGAVALAARGYPRYTEDVDLAVALPLSEFEVLAHSLRSEFSEVSLAHPDAQDPLGGVITIRETGALPIQIINFDNSPSGGFPRLVQDALVRAEIHDGTLAKIPLAEDLVFFKLYAGGPKSNLDILELMTRTRIDIERLRTRAAEYRMTRELEAVLRLVDSTD